MPDYKLSYIVTTYNKLPYLQHVMRRLVAARQEDEEIVVCDGGSKDGTTDYLQNLYDIGQIQQYVSERDKGEAHGFNKGMLMARGEIIKIITDDDAFHYPCIRQAADFMLQTPGIDVVMGYNASIYIDSIIYANIIQKPAIDFEQWIKFKTPFWMIGLPLLIRRKSLPLTGLFFSGVVLVDADFTYRITSLNVNIGWCTGVLSMHVSNPDGNYNRMSIEERKNELDILSNYYVRSDKPTVDTKLQKYKFAIGQGMKSALEVIKRPIRPVKRAVFERFGWKQIAPQIDLEGFPTNYTTIAGEDELTAIYRVCDEVLTSSNANRVIEFLYRDSEVSKVFNPK